VPHELADVRRWSAKHAAARDDTAAQCSCRAAMPMPKPAHAARFAERATGACAGSTMRHSPARAPSSALIFRCWKRARGPLQERGVACRSYAARAAHRRHLVRVCSIFARHCSRAQANERRTHICSSEFGSIEYALGGVGEQQSGGKYSDAYSTQNSITDVRPMESITVALTWPGPSGCQRTSLAKVGPS